ncbi:hypothetical protein HLK59_13305 [Streptomyces sp. S3(2020)]|uniref:hypothetical protein n=1 Tax=Streptomyces sp. S3(2020) TaxID=2732044 RepID=UPI001487C072|nr:hypothetical protein [Streptomyces sp. S3(2020)]NNN31327.1 hypothetical protein [Streptomyces sp. S3(2020)]
MPVTTLLPMNLPLTNTPPIKGRRVRTRAAVVGLSLSMALLTGCGGGDGTESAADGGEKPSGKPVASGPAYQGAALPGYARKAAWSLPTDNPELGVLDLGAVLLFARDASGEYLTDATVDGEPDDVNRVLFSSDEAQKVTLEFRDVRTGAVTKTLGVTAQSVEGVTWKDGAPAIAVGTSATKESDGLTQEETTTSATLYSVDGTKLGETSGYGFGHVVAGYAVAAADGAVTLTPVGGGTARTVPCNGDDDAECDFDAETGIASGDKTFAPVIAGGYYPGFEAAGNYDYDPSDVTLNDLTTGKQVWSSADAEVPKGVVLDDGEPRDRTIRVVKVSDGKLLVAWKKDIGLSPAPQVYAWYDLASGALTASYEGGQLVVYSADGSLAALDKSEFDTGFDGTALWKTADGSRLWAQEEGENALDPIRFSGNGEVLYGSTGDGELAVDVKTRKVLAKDLTAVPDVNARTGYGYLATEDGFFVFAPA